MSWLKLVRTQVSCNLLNVGTWTWSVKMPSCPVHLESKCRPTPLERHFLSLLDYYIYICIWIIWYGSLLHSDSKHGTHLRLKECGFDVGDVVYGNKVWWVGDLIRWQSCLVRWKMRRGTRGQHVFGHISKCLNWWPSCSHSRCIVIIVTL